ncbi:MAG: cell division protein FtsE, partial [Pseudomonadota bacterium]
ELNRLGRSVLIATHDMDLIRAAKSEVPARILRLSAGVIHQAEVDA